MRRSYRPHLLKTDEGLIYGVYAEADFCAEHENGLGYLHREMGCGKITIEGIERYQPSDAVISSGSFPVVEKGKFWFRGEDGRKKWIKRRFISSRPNSRMPDDGFLYGSDEVSVFFSESAFLMAARTDEADGFIGRLQEAAKTRDIAVFMGGFGSRNPFNRGGLVICIPSLVSSEDKLTLKESHENARLLEEAAAKTGVRERVAAKVEDTCGSSGWRFNSPYHLYAIKPGWASMIKSRRDGMPIETVHDVIFFINDGKAIHGWYTVEELDAWLEGYGKVLDDCRA